MFEVYDFALGGLGYDLRRSGFEVADHVGSFDGVVWRGGEEEFVVIAAGHEVFDGEIQFLSLR